MFHILSNWTKRKMEERQKTLINKTKQQGTESKCWNWRRKDEEQPRTQMNHSYTLTNWNCRTKTTRKQAKTRKLTREERKVKRMLMKMEERLDDHATRSMNVPRWVCKPPHEKTMILQDKTREEGSKALQCSLQFWV